MPVFARFDSIDGEASDESNDDRLFFKSWYMSGDAGDRPTEEISLRIEETAGGVSRSVPKPLEIVADGRVCDTVDTQNDLHVGWTF